VIRKTTRLGMGCDLPAFIDRVRPVLERLF
jgi:hypothetical protein